MKKLIITILALATISLAAKKPICTEIYNTDEYVEFSCKSDIIRTSTLKISKNLDSITLIGEYTDGDQFYKEDTRYEFVRSRHVSKVKDSYGIIAVNEDKIYGSRSMEQVYQTYRNTADFN